jgi:hypothetical protein
MVFFINNWISLVIYSLDTIVVFINIGYLIVFTDTVDDLIDNGISFVIWGYEWIDEMF